MNQELRELTPDAIGQTAVLHRVLFYLFIW